MTDQNEELVWGATSGNYGSSQFLKEHRSMVISIEQVLLQNTEIWLYQMIDHLAVKALEQGRDFLMVLDLEGMKGVTIEKLARMHYPLPVCFCVSSISRYPVFSQYEPTTLIASPNLIYRIGGQVDKISAASLRLPSGILVPTVGNVDLLLEVLSVSAWSLIPERDVDIIAQLLSPLGIYTTPDKSPIGAVFRHFLMEPFLNERFLGLQLARDRLIAQYDMVKVDSVEKGSLKGSPFEWLVYRKRGAPEIEINFP